MSDFTQKEIEDRKEFLQIRQHYIDNADKSSNFFDRTLITLSTSLLGGSMVFINNIKNNYDIIKNNHEISISRCVLLARILLGFTMLITLISFILSENVHRLSVNKYDLEYLSENEKGLNCESCKKIGALEGKIRYINKWIGSIKWISILTLIVGVGFLVSFLFINI